MRTITGVGGISLFLNNKEWELIEEKSEVFVRSSLKDDQKYLASQMHRRGILTASRVDNDIKYKLNKNSGWYDWYNI